MKQRRWLAPLLALALILTACLGDDAGSGDGDAGGDGEAEDRGTITVGFIPGPYADLFRGGVAPALEADGWTVEIEEISDFTIPNQATMDGELDMTIFQNDAFMELYNSENEGDLVSLIKIPSAPLGLYPGRGSATTPEEIEDGAVMGITSEASNLARSLNFLQSLGLVEIGEVAEGQLATPDDLTSNPKNLTFELIDAPQVPRALPDVDYGLALGNHIYAADNVTLADAIALEVVPEASQIIVTVRGDNADAEFAEAVVEVIQSDDFKAYVEADPNWSGFQKPDWWD